MSIKCGLCCLQDMKKAKTVKKPENEDLPFSFSEKDVADEKIKAHWERVRKKIEQASPLSPKKRSND